MSAILKFDFQKREHLRLVNFLNYTKKTTASRGKCLLHVFLFFIFFIDWRNFSILSPKFVSACAENILSDSRLKTCAKCKSG